MPASTMVALVMTMTSNRNYVKGYEDSLHIELVASCLYSLAFLEGLFSESGLPEMPILGNSEHKKRPGLLVPRPVRMLVRSLKA